MTEVLFGVKVGGEMSRSKRFIECVACGKRIYENDLCFRHEYGNKYCSPLCLCTHGFYGHFKTYNLTEDKLEDECVVIIFE